MELTLVAEPARAAFAPVSGTSYCGLQVGHRAS
jgi:hypothetical protein